jgi:microcystin-dependent protein
LLSIASNSALFSILGTNYGGDGENTFGLPDLRGRVPMHAGAGPGLSSRSLGQKGGFETQTLPSHTHAVGVSSLHGDSSTPVGNKLAVSSAGTGLFSPTADETMAADFVQTSGSDPPDNNTQPYLTLNYIIALSGTFPSQS